MLKYVIILFCCAFSSSEEIKVFHKNDYNFIYSKKFKIPLYVKYTINRSDINGTVKRTNNFKSDKKISQKLSESDKITIKEMINKLTVKEITNFISKNTNVPKKEIYNYCLEIRNEN